MMSDDAKKVALVTGGSRGIGRAIVERLADDGFAVAFNYVRNAEAAKAVEDAVAAAGGTAKGYQADVADFEQVKAWIDQVKTDFGGMDVLVNNAGIIADKVFMMMTPEEWGRVIDTNLNGMFHTARACVVPMLKKRKGVIINVSSVSGIIGLPGQTNYSATKGGMNAFTKALAKEVSPYGVRVNAVAPGFIDTEILSGIKDDYRAKVLAQIPFGRIGEPKEVAAVVSFLAGEKSAYITGQILVVDGGLAMR